MSQDVSSSSSQASLSSSPLPSKLKPFLGSTSSVAERRVDNKSQSSRQVLKTEDDGDCAFHAVLGDWDEEEQQVICAEAKPRRAEVKRAIEDSKGGSRIRKLAVAGVKELIMAGRTLGEESRKLFNAYQQFLTHQNASSPQLWQTFETELRKYQDVVDHIAGLHQHPKGATASLREQFYDALNRKEDELYAIIRSLTDLDAAFRRYNESTKITYNWERTVSSEVIAEYAQFIGKPGQWLLQSEVAILAEVFHITVNYYSAPGANVETFNSGQPKRVVVQFNGRNHFEQVGPASKSGQKDSKDTTAKLADKRDNKKTIEQLAKALYDLDLLLREVTLKDTQAKKDILSRIYIAKKAGEKLKEHITKGANPKPVEQSLKDIQAQINSINRRFKDSEKSLAYKTALSALCDQITALVKTIYQAYFPEKGLIVTSQARQILLQHAQRLYQSQQTVEQKPAFNALLTGIKDRSL